MNTTFTTCAEKKAKQFLNLLQGYTRGIRITAILILLLMGVSNAWAARTFKSGQKIYFKDAKDSDLNNSTWKVSDGNIYAYFWNNSENAWSSYGNLVSGSWNTENAIYEFTVPGSGKTYTKMLFTRGTVANWDGKWNQTGDQTPNDGQNIFYISSGTWGAYAKNGAIVGSMNNWNPDSNPLSSNTVTISLNYTTSKTYEFKVLYGETYYGTSTAISNTVSNQAFSTSGNNCTLNLVVASGAKDYTFTWDNSGKKLSVTYPTAYTVTYSRVPTAAANAPTTSPSVTSGSAVASGTSVAFTAQAAKTGYTWEGWYDNNAGTGNALSTNLAYTRSITANTTIYAVYTANTYTVKFDANGGSGNMSNQNFTYGTAQNLTPNSFTRTGYTFAGWATSANGNKVYNDKQSVSNLSSTNGATVILYAKWTPINYTITYNTNGGSGTMAPTSYTIETATFDLPTPTKDGCTFVGWYDNEGFTGDAVTQIAKGSYGNKTFYAKWKALSFELTWDLNGGRITEDGTPKGQVEAGTPLIAPTVEKDHYDHSGWSPEVPAVMPGKDATYTAQWTPKKYTITYNLNGGSGTMTPTSYTIESETFALPNNPTKTGHTFAGWYANAELTGEAVTQIEKGSTGDKAYWAKWDVANYTINFDLEGGTGGTTTELTVPFEAQLPNITIPTKAGYLFLGYYNGDDGTGTQYYDASGKGLKTMPANNLTLHAKWLNGSDCIFFYNNLGWSNVYVYFYNNADGHNYWADGYGTGANKQQQFWNNNPYWEMEHGTMTQIKGTNIWYYYATYIKTNQRSKVSFANVNQSCDKEANNTNSYFQNAKVVYRADLDYEKRLPMFVPHTTQSHYFSNTKSTYYNHGYWMNYPENTGYKLHIFDENGNKINDQLVEIPFEYGDNTIMPWSVSVSLEGAKTYAFKIQRADDTWYGNNGKMTTNSSGDVGQTAWEFTTGTNNCKITTTAPGTYVFTLKYGIDRNSNYNYLVGVEYPASVGDYRLAYKDDTHPFHPGHLLKKRDGKDTVSFFVHHNLSPVIMLQEVTNINATTGDITWNTISTTENLNGISATGIYNFILEQSGDEATLLNTITEYNGDFYIRTDAAEGGWDSFRQKSNQITYSSFADKHSNFNHYYCKYIEAGRNVKFTIANDYSYCISDTLDNDAIILPNQSSLGCLPVNANVRFGWDSNTNEISRAYIKGAGMTSDRFLVLQGKDSNLKDANGNDILKGDGDRTGLEANEEILVDQENWIYQVDVTANKNTLIKLIADYNGTTQYFKGSDKEYTGLLSSTASKDYKIRLVYDFKSNHLVTAWLAGGNTVEGEQTLGADMMVIRKDQNTADQLNFNPLASPLDEVGTGYAVMTFTEPHITDNTKTERERSLYWVSFPFDVKVSDVFGFGEYAEHWILQYYDGAERAKKGLFSDSGTYWKYIFDTDTKLKAGEGYVLVLDLDKIEFLHGAKEVSLYFPSTNPLTTISGVLPTEHEVPAHECTIDREFEDDGTTYNHKFTDSHWNLIGVPGFADITGFDVTQYSFMQDDASFYYNFSLANSTYTVESSPTTNFQAMYAYMVQFAGTINWSATPPEVYPAELAARRYSDDQPEKVVLRLELAQGEEVADRTFVQLQREGATANFDLSLDLTKIVNIGVSNIYTLTDSLKIQVAGNALPMEETVVPVGVNIAAAGEYTFCMPDGTEGMVVELIDYETNTRANLLLSDYTVNLPAGSNETRFALSIKPEKVATSIETTTTSSNQKVRKFIIDGKLYLQKDGVVYDAQGHIVR